MPPAHGQLSVFDATGPADIGPDDDRLNPAAPAAPLMLHAVTFEDVSSGYDALPAAGQAAFFAKLGVNPANSFHPGGRFMNASPTAPRMSGEATLAAWNRKLGVDAAAALVAMCGDRDALDVLARRDRRKKVQLAIMANPHSDHRYCWEAADRRLGDHADRDYDSCLARRFHTVDVEYFAQILGECGEYGQTRHRMLADDRLGPDEFHDVVLGALDRIDERWRFDAAHRRRDTIRVAEAVVGRLTDQRLPMLGIRAELVEAIFARPVSERIVATFAAAIDTADEDWFLSLLLPDDGTDIRTHNGDSYTVDGFMYEAMARRRGMSPAWYRVPARSTSQRAVTLCAENPDVPDDLLGSVGIESLAAIGRLGAHWGDNTAAWNLAAELLCGTTRPPTMGELVALVDAAIG